MPDVIPIRRALISVSDKTDLLPFARKLAAFGVQLISTGGTARALQEAGIAVTPIEAVTGFPEMMDGRVKTLHPKVHGGLLARRDRPEHVQAMADHGIQAIDLVCVNLYPFERTVAAEGVTESEAIEQIDIGGPSMVRSGAKNMDAVAVVTSPDQYDRVSAELDQHGGGTSLTLRRWLASAAFARTAAYDAAIAAWMFQRNSGSSPEPHREMLPTSLVLRYQKASDLRYGENPHQEGAAYIDPTGSELSILHAQQLHGKELSFCNLYDADGALELVKEFNSAREAAAAIIKHANPCGLAAAPTASEAFQAAYEGDPLAAYGGIVCINQVIDLATAQSITAIQSFFDVIIAPGFDPDALEVLKSRWKNTRLLRLPGWTEGDRRTEQRDLKFIRGGLLAHRRDHTPMQPEAWDHAAGPTPDASLLQELRLAMIAAKHLKSNAVSLVRGGMLVGAGAGQMDRVASCRIAIQKADDRAKGAVAASDAFFPFPDGPELLIQAGVRAIAHPGGSIRDGETKTVCEQAGVTLLITGTRHFRH